MRTDEEYASKAAALWRAFTENDRSLVAFGLFPATAMDAEEKEGFDPQRLAVALMKHWREMAGAP